MTTDYAPLACSLFFILAIDICLRIDLIKLTVYDVG